MSKVKLISGVAAVLIGGYVVAAPYITVYQMKVAAEKQDGESLSEHIEFPTLRQDLKDQLNVMFASKLANDKEMKNNPFAGLATLLVGTFVDKAVDSYVSPAGVTKLMMGEKIEVKPDSNDASNLSKEEPFKDAHMGYESLHKFVISTEMQPGKKVKFVLRRRGIDWKLTEIKLPPV
jgi:hypothetical protein